MCALIFWFVNNFVKKSNPQKLMHARKKQLSFELIRRISLEDKRKSNFLFHYNVVKLKMQLEVDSVFFAVW